jgi:hypothetical protein
MHHENGCGTIRQAGDWGSLTRFLFLRTCSKFFYLLSVSRDELDRIGRYRRMSWTRVRRQRGGSSATMAQAFGRRRQTRVKIIPWPDIESNPQSMSEDERLSRPSGSLHCTSYECWLSLIATLNQSFFG